MAYNPDSLSYFTESKIVGIGEEITDQISIKSVTMTESLLTPGLQTSINLDYFIDTPIIKNFELLKNKVYNFGIKRDILADYKFEDTMEVSTRIYRMSNRKRISDSMENFTLHCCDDSLLIDAMHLVSKSWSCVTPDIIVTEVLEECLGVEPDKIKIMPKPAPARDYIAQNIHPFQVISQQATVALDISGGPTAVEPTYLHYMTYEDIDFGEPRGTHYFRSLKNMVEEGKGLALAKYRFVYSGASEQTPDSSGDYKEGYNNPHTILSYDFPCDFDLLSDVLNGVGFDGEVFASLMVINPKIKLASLLGDDTVGCGMGMGPIKTALSNIVSYPEQFSCPTDVEHWMLLRQARMNLLEQDKIALRLTVPWNPELHVGMMLQAIFPTPFGDISLGGGSVTGTGFLYGSGEYIIASLTHHVLNGGYSTTTMDCIAQTAGIRGEV